METISHYDISWGWHPYGFSSDVWDLIHLEWQPPSGLRSLSTTDNIKQRRQNVLTKEGSSFWVWYTGFAKDFVNWSRCGAVANFNKNSEIVGRCRSIGSEYSEFCKWGSSTCGWPIKLAFHLATTCIFCTEWLCINFTILFVCLKECSSEM